MAADTLLRLSILMDAPALETRALALLSSMSRSSEDNEFLAAPYAMAIQRTLVRERVVVYLAAVVAPHAVADAPGPDAAHDAREQPVEVGLGVGALDQVLGHWAEIEHRGGIADREVLVVDLVEMCRRRVALPAVPGERLGGRDEVRPGQGMRARSIGPAGMSGRIASIDVVNSNPDIIYVGAATGGVWKSINGGTTWTPVFDNQPVAAIGAVSVYQANPAIVWVGTGEGNPRNSASVGNGVFKSMDGGLSWKQMGLEGTERIHRIVLDPGNPDVAYVAAMGQMWGVNRQRGVYRTTDGGKTWQNILFVNEKTGCADLAMDPSNPKKLFAAMWEYRRWPWFFTSGGQGSGLYVSHDGGETWRKVTAEDGIPKGDLGRIGIAIARNNPRVVYALIEATKSVLCRSDDGGKTWRA